MNSNEKTLVTSKEREVFRDTLKESRENYYVIYDPADSGLFLACLHLTFLQNDISASEIISAMDRECRVWLTKYPVPLMVTSFDATGSVINLQPEKPISSLIGFIDPKSQKLISEWRIIANEELPPEQSQSAYLEKIYKGIPFRYRDDVRRKALEDMRSQGKALRALKFFFFLVVAVPVILEIVSLRIELLGHLLAAISIFAGLYKVAKTLEWIKPTAHEREKAEVERKMKHYFYHCELNPSAFLKLKCENFENESIKSSHQEAESLKRVNKATEFSNEPSANELGKP